MKHDFRIQVKLKVKKNYLIPFVFDFFFVENWIGFYAKERDYLVNVFLLSISKDRNWQFSFGCRFNSIGNVTSYRIEVT